MMAVVTLNRLVFEQAVDQVLERIQTAVRDFETAADKVQVRAGGALAQEVRECGVAMRQEVETAFDDFRRAVPTCQRDAGSGGRATRDHKWLTMGLALALVLFGLGIWVGTRLG
jgi:hypothetical protein